MVWGPPILRNTLKIASSRDQKPVSCSPKKILQPILGNVGNALHTLCVQWCSHMLEITDVDNTRIAEVWGIAQWIGFLLETLPWISIFFPWNRGFSSLKHGSLNVPIEHHPTIRYMVYNGYYKVMSNIPKMGQLPTPVKPIHWIAVLRSTLRHGQPSAPASIWSSKLRNIQLMKCCRGTWHQHNQSTLRTW